MRETISCYKGAHQESWNSATSDLIYFIQEILPKATVIGHFNGIMVHPDFPAFQHNSAGEQVFEYKRIADQTNNALDLFSSELSRIVPAEANEREAFVLSKLNSIKKLLCILTKRIDVYGKFLTTFTDSRNLGAVAFSGDTALAILLHRGTKDPSLKGNVVEKILSQYQEFSLLKNKWKSSAAIFEQASSKLATLENLVYNEHFNKNSFLNYHKYKNEISGFLSFQNAHWGEMISYLNASNISKMKPFILRTMQAQIRQGSSKSTNPFLPSNIAIADITNTNIITHNLARTIGCTGQPILIKFNPVYGGEDKVATTMLYNLELKTPSNSVYIQAFGTESPICKSKQSSDEWIQNMSTQLRLPPKQILNEEKTIELLIGTRNVTAHHHSDLLSTGFQEKSIIISHEDFEGGTPIHYFNIKNAYTLL